MVDATGVNPVVKPVGFGTTYIVATFAYVDGAVYREYNGFFKLNVTPLPEQTGVPSSASNPDAVDSLVYPVLGAGADFSVAVSYTHLPVRPIWCCAPAGPRWAG